MSQQFMINILCQSYTIFFLFWVLWFARFNKDKRLSYEMGEKQGKKKHPIRDDFTSDTSIQTRPFPWYRSIFALIISISIFPFLVLRENGMAAVKL